MAGHLHHGSSTRDAVRAPTLADCAFECVRATAASAFECATFSYSLVAAESDAANCALSALPAGDIIINQGRTRGFFHSLKLTIKCSQTDAETAGGR